MYHFFLFLEVLIYKWTLFWSLKACPFAKYKKNYNDLEKEREHDEFHVWLNLFQRDFIYIIKSVMTEQANETSIFNIELLIFIQDSS